MSNCFGDRMKGFMTTEELKGHLRIKNEDDEYFEGKQDARINMLAESLHHIGNSIEKMAEATANKKPPITINIIVNDSTNPEKANAKVKEIIKGINSL